MSSVLNSLLGATPKKDDKPPRSGMPSFGLNQNRDGQKTWLKAELPQKKAEAEGSTDLHSHDFGGRKIHFEPHFQREVHHLASMHPEERRDLFRMAKTHGMVHYESRPGVHMIVRHNHDGTYTLEHGRR